MMLATSITNVTDMWGVGVGGCRVQLAANADIVASRAEKKSNNNNNKVNKEDPKLEGEGRRRKDSFGLISGIPSQGTWGKPGG